MGPLSPNVNLPGNADPEVFNITKVGKVAGCRAEGKVERAGVPWARNLSSTKASQDAWRFGTKSRCACRLEAAGG